MSDRTVTFSELADENLLEIGAGRPRSAGLDRYPLPILRVADVLDGRIESSFQDYAPDTYRQAMGPKISKPGDIVLTTKGTVGRVAVMPSEGPDFAYSPQLCYFRPIANGPLRPRYLYYWFKSKEFWNQADALKGQTDMADFLSLSDIHSLKMRLPSLEEQTGIIDVLGSLDDKIAVNDAIALTSQELAINLGQRLIAEDGDTEALLQDYVQITKGVSYRSADLVKGGGSLVTLKCVGRNNMFQPGGLKPFIGECKASQVLEDGDITVAQTDLTQRAEVIGRPVRVPSSSREGRRVASLDLAIARPVNGLTREVLFALLATKDFHNHALSYCNGTTVLHMSARALPEYQFKIPDPIRIEKVSAQMRPLLTRSDHARQENHTLVPLRDTLLPKLMSGEIRVRDAEKAVEEAV